MIWPCYIDHIKVKCGITWLNCNTVWTVLTGVSGESSKDSPLGYSGACLSGHLLFKDCLTFLFVVGEF